MPKSPSVVVSVPPPILRALDASLEPGETRSARIISLIRADLLARTGISFRQTRPPGRPKKKKEQKNMQAVYVVRDAGGEYVSPSGKRTPASDEAMEFETRKQAKAACSRATDKVLSRGVE